MRFLLGESAGKIVECEAPPIRKSRGGDAGGRHRPAEDPRLGQRIDSDCNRPGATLSRSRAGWTLNGVQSFPPGPGDGAAGAE